MKLKNKYDVYCIAIESRRNHAKKFIHKMGYNNCIFLPPVLRDKLNYNNLIDNKIITSWMGIPYPSSKDYMGKVACSMSHAKVLKHFLESNSEVALIFEDDNKIPNDPFFTKKQLESYFQIPDWDFINLSPYYYNCLFSKTKNGLYKATGYATSAYLITRNGAKAFLDIMFPLQPIKNVALDVKIDLIPNAYEVRPRLFNQRDDFGSTNGNDVVRLNCIIPKIKDFIIIVSLQLLMMILYIWFFKINFKNSILFLLIFIFIFDIKSLTIPIYISYSFFYILKRL